MPTAQKRPDELRCNDTAGRRPDIETSVGFSAWCQKLIILMPVSMAGVDQGRYLSQRAAFGFSLVVAYVSTVNSDTLDIKEAFSSTTHIQRSLHDVDLVDVCSSVQSFEQLETAVNVELQTVEIHPEAWAFTTRCRQPGKACKGFTDNVQSICRPKKSWVQVYGRTMGDTWKAHWVAVDTACACSIRRKRPSFFTHRIPFSGKTFLN